MPGTSSPSPPPLPSPPQPVPISTTTAKSAVINQALVVALSSLPPPPTAPTVADATTQVSLRAKTSQEYHQKYEVAPLPSSSSSSSPSVSSYTTPITIGSTNTNLSFTTTTTMATRPPSSSSLSVIAIPASSSETMPFLPVPSLEKSHGDATTVVKVNVNIVVGGGTTHVSTPKRSNHCRHQRVVKTPVPLPPPSPPVVTEPSSSTTTHDVSMSVDRPPPLAFVAAFIRHLYYHIQEQEPNHQLPIQMPMSMPPIIEDEEIQKKEDHENDDADDENETMSSQSSD